VWQLQNPSDRSVKAEKAPQTPRFDFSPKKPKQGISFHQIVESISREKNPGHSMTSGLT
jgi:hypothetical protein